MGVLTFVISLSCLSIVLVLMGIEKSLKNIGLNLIEINLSLHKIGDKLDEICSKL